MIALEDVRVSVPGHPRQKPLLDELCLVSDARKIAVIGANGSGKSTFARLLNGLVLPNSGSVSIDGLCTRQQTAEVRRLVGFVFQNPDLQFVYPTVVEDLTFGLKNLRLSSEEIPGRVDDILARFGLLHLKNRAVHTLSGGEKQLVCLAAVLVMQPQLIVCDEPTTLLDLANTRRVDRHLLSLTESVVVVTHDLAFAATCEQVVLIHQGRLEATGEPPDVIARYTALVDGMITP